MKTFTVELRRTSFITVTVEAESIDQAKDKAWDEVVSYNHDSKDADWEIGYTEEQTA